MTEPWENIFSGGWLIFTDIFSILRYASIAVCLLSIIVGLIRMQIANVCGSSKVLQEEKGSIVDRIITIIFVSGFIAVISFVKELVEMIFL